MKARKIGTRQIATCVLGCWLGGTASLRVASLAAEEKAASESAPQSAPEPPRHAVKGADPIAANPAPSQAAEKGPSNQQIADAVASALRAQPQIRGYKLNLEVRDGVVDLLGEVRDAAQRQALVQVIRSVPGVVDVRDQMAGPGTQAAQFQVPADVSQPIQPTQPAQQPMMQERPTNQLPQLQPQMQPPAPSTIPSLIGQRDYDQQPTAQMAPMQQPMLQQPMMQPYPMPYPQMPYPQMMPQQPMMAHPMMMQQMQQMQQPMMQQPMMAPMQTPWGVRYMPVSMPMMAQGQPQFPPAPTPEGKMPMPPMNPNVPAMPNVPRMPEPGASNMPADPYPIATSPSIPDPNMTPPPLPPYAWPTYAPYNNYSRVAYPESYPYQAWPFIGPVYPFPKVPLGWRSVNLTWEDGFWWLGKHPSAHDWWRIRYR